MDKFCSSHQGKNIGYQDFYDILIKLKDTARRGGKLPYEDAINLVNKFVDLDYAAVADESVAGNNNNDNNNDTATPNYVQSLVHNLVYRLNLLKAAAKSSTDLEGQVEACVRKADPNLKLAVYNWTIARNCSIKQQIEDSETTVGDNEGGKITRSLENACQAAKRIIKSQVDKFAKEQAKLSPMVRHSYIYHT